MARERKTIDEFDIQVDYGEGYETLHCEPTRWAARQSIKEYRANEPGISFRIKKHRIRKSTLPQDQIEAHYHDVVMANKRMMEEHLKKKETRGELSKQES